MQKKKLENLTLPKHRFHSFFKQRKIPFNKVAFYVDCSSPRFYHIINAHTVCPPDLEKKLERLVRQLLIEEESGHV